jgi:DNA-binding transcriptional regulator YhcF (GntR family)
MPRCEKLKFSKYIEMCKEKSSNLRLVEKILQELKDDGVVTTTRKNEQT